MGKKTKKMTKKKWITLSAVAIAAVLAVTLLLPQFLHSKAGSAMAMARTVTVQTGTIETTVSGSGNMAASNTLDIRIPGSVTVDEVLVEAGDTVSEGDTLAVLNNASLQKAILDTQDELASIDAQINSVKGDTESKYITSSVSGRVKQIYAAEGENTQDTVSRDGSLMLLSIDGKMKATFAPSSAGSLAYGDEVSVTLSDGTSVEGTVAALSSSSCTVTLTDNGPAYGDTVTIADSDGNEIGSTALEISAPIKVLGGTGTIASIDVDLNDSVGSGTTLITLSEGAVSREYEELLSQRTEYENVLQMLLNYANTGSIVADTAGTISAVSVTASGDSSFEASSSSSAQSSVPAASGVSEALSGPSDDEAFLLAAAVDSTDSGVVLPAADAAAITPIGGTTEIFINNPVTGNTPQSTIMPGSGYTGSITWSPSGSKFEAGVAYTATVTLTAGSGYCFSADAKASVTGAQIDESKIRVSMETEGNSLTFEAVFPATAEASSAGTAQPSSGEGNASADTDTGGASLPSSGSSGSAVGGTAVASATSTAASGSSSSDDSASSSESSLLTSAFTLLVGDADTLTVSVDELDILSVAVGQEVSVVLDAFEDQTFHGTVTKISSSGNAQTGVTTYPVTITLADAAGAGIKAGMNANATISVATSENVLYIPLDALQESGNEQFVYIAGGTGEAGEASLGERRAVETGLSDGANVEITSGLSEGEQISYMEVESDDSSEQSFPGGMGDMGGAPGGSMPDSISMPDGSGRGGAPGGAPMG